MDLHVKRIDISAGESQIVILTKRAAITHDLHPSDRVQIEANGKKFIATVDTTGGGFGLHDDQIGMFFETAFELGVENFHLVSVKPAPKPESIKIIKKKMEGKELTDDEIGLLTRDIVDQTLTQVELTYFVAATSIYPLSFREIATFTRAMADTGVRLQFENDKHMVIDKHCIGGVPGNRTSMITVPIMASLGFVVPKTSSRAITSPAGTADTMEVLANVTLSAAQMSAVVNKTGGCIVWGGSVNLAPADDRIIKLERPLSIDVEGLMLASVMAKKYSVGSTHVLIDIPYGSGAKVPNIEKAREMQQRFECIGELLGMHMLVLTTDGSQPVGNGVGPLLEAYDVLSVLRCDLNAPQDLREKSLMIAGKLLEFIGYAKKDEGHAMAEQELASGRAYAKFQEILDAQGKNEVPPLGRYKQDILASRTGTVVAIDNLGIAKLARMAGAPVSKNAGLLLYQKKNSAVDVGEKLFTIFAESPEKLANAVLHINEAGNPYRIE